MICDYCASPVEWLLVAGKLDEAAILHRFVCDECRILIVTAGSIGHPLSGHPDYEKKFGSFRYDEILESKLTGW